MARSRILLSCRYVTYLDLVHTLSLGPIVQLYHTKEKLVRPVHPAPARIADCFYGIYLYLSPADTRQEVFNSPYAVPMFRQYAEKIPSVDSWASTPKESLAESIKMLSQVAKEAGVWLIGGGHLVALNF